MPTRWLEQAHKTIEETAGTDDFLAQFIPRDKADRQRILPWLLTIFGGFCNIAYAIGCGFQTAVPCWTALSGSVPLAILGLLCTFVGWAAFSTNVSLTRDTGHELVDYCTLWGKWLYKSVIELILTNPSKNYETISEKTNDYTLYLSKQLPGQLHPNTLYFQSLVNDQTLVTLVNYKGESFRFTLTPDDLRGLSGPNKEKNQSIETFLHEQGALLPVNGLSDDANQIKASIDTKTKTSLINAAKTKLKTLLPKAQEGLGAMIAGYDCFYEKGDAISKTKQFIHLTIGFGITLTASLLTAALTYHEMGFFFKEALHLSLLMPLSLPIALGTIPAFAFLLLPDLGQLIFYPLYYLGLIQNGITQSLKDLYQGKVSSTIILALVGLAIYGIVMTYLGLRADFILEIANWLPSISATTRTFLGTLATCIGLIAEVPFISWTAVQMSYYLWNCAQDFLYEFKAAQGKSFWRSLIDISDTACFSQAWKVILGLLTFGLLGIVPWNAGANAAISAKGARDVGKNPIIAFALGFLNSFNAMIRTPMLEKCVLLFWHKPIETVFSWFRTSTTPQTDTHAPKENTVAVKLKEPPPTNYTLDLTDLTTLPLGKESSPVCRY